MDGILKAVVNLEWRTINEVTRVVYVADIGYTKRQRLLKGQGPYL